MTSALNAFEVWRWMIEAQEPAELDFSKVMIAGEGPFDQPTIDDFLEQRGIEVWTIQKALETLVLGQDGWNPDELDELIERRRGKTLKVYSQEMLLAYLVTAEDPYQDAEILSAFAKEHSGLEFLRVNGFDWPTTVVGPSPSLQAKLEATWPATGVLKRMGYRVGNSGIDAAKRRQILAETFKGELPFVESKEHMATWGEPGSHMRLKKIADSLAALARNAKKQDRRDMSSAVRHWEADLGWLQDTYYHGRFNFSWPSTWVK